MAMSDSDSLTVVDLFCGAGGFSEGFHQMGFDVIFGLDFWEPATETIEMNHPGIETRTMDIMELETAEDINETIPDADVIIGGPPCQNFSRSNKAGKADKTEGLNLIEMMLRIVAWKQEHGGLKYWALENVPTTKKHIKERYTWDELRLPGEGAALEVPRKQILNSANFGVPQTRRRMICGNYPDPERTHDEDEWKTMREVFEHLGSPRENPSSVGTVDDPSYDVELDASQVTDHFYDSRVEEYRWKRARRLKEDHGYMGKMSFPEELDRPSRTVMATRSASTRESMIFGVDEDGDGEHEDYRLPTVREIACFMSFPIHFQFEASTEAKKYRLVGNAVPCRMAAAIAGAIAEAEGVEVPEAAYPAVDEVEKPSKELTGREWERRTPRKRRDDAQYYRHVPYLQPRTFRVEIDNQESDFSDDEVVWSTVLHKGQGRRAIETEPSEQSVRELVESDLVYDDHDRDLDSDDIDWVGFESDLRKRVLAELPDAATFQEVYVHRGQTEDLGPDETLETIREIIDTYLPEDRYAEVEVVNDDHVDLDVDQIPIRIVAALLACKLVTKTVMAADAVSDATPSAAPVAQED